MTKPTREEWKQRMIEDLKERMGVEGALQHLAEMFVDQAGYTAKLMLAVDKHCRGESVAEDNPFGKELNECLHRHHEQVHSS